MRIVSKDDVGRDEDIVLDGHQLKEAASVDAHSVADPVPRLEHRVGSDRDIVADDVVLSDRDAVPRLEPIADRRSTVDCRELADGTRARRRPAGARQPRTRAVACPATQGDSTTVPSPRRRRGRSRAGRVPSVTLGCRPPRSRDAGQGRSRTAALRRPQVLEWTAASVGARMPRFPLLRIDASARSSARTTLRPLAPSVLGRLPVRTLSTKCLASTPSGSQASRWGETMSPGAVRHLELAERARVHAGSRRGRRA